MSRAFRRVLPVICLLLISFSVRAGVDRVYRPAWADSVLVHAGDSAALAALQARVLVRDAGQAVFLLQPLRTPGASPFFIGFLVAVLAVAMLLRLLFDDFSDALVRGVLSGKDFFVSLRTNKYDSPVPMAYLFLARQLVLAVLVYLALEQLRADPWFDPGLLLRVIGLVLAFSVLRSLAEGLFNWSIGTTAVFKAFTLQQLFIDFTFGMLLLAVCLVYLYQPGAGTGSSVVGLMLAGVVYIVFNTIRSYQLLRQVRVPFSLHFFIYICSFKILPVLILAKYLLTNL